MAGRSGCTALTNSSCSLTRRILRALPRSDRTRDGVDIGVRAAHMLPGAGELEKVMGEKAMPEIDGTGDREDAVWQELTSSFARRSSGCEGHLQDGARCWTDGHGFILLQRREWIALLGRCSLRRAGRLFGRCTALFRRRVVGFRRRSHLERGKLWVMSSCDWMALFYFK